MMMTSSGELNTAGRERLRSSMGAGIMKGMRDGDHLQ